MPCSAGHFCIREVWASHVESRWSFRFNSSITGSGRDQTTTAPMVMKTRMLRSNTGWRILISTIQSATNMPILAVHLVRRSIKPPCSQLCRHGPSSRCCSNQPRRRGEQREALQAATSTKMVVGNPGNRAPIMARAIQTQVSSNQPQRNGGLIISDCVCRLTEGMSEAPYLDHTVWIMGQDSPKGQFKSPLLAIAQLNHQLQSRLAVAVFQRCNSVPDVSKSGWCERGEIPCVRSCR